MTKARKRCIALVHILEWLHEASGPTIDKLAEMNAKRLDSVTFNPEINPYGRQDHSQRER